MNASGKPDDLSVGSVGKPNAAYWQTVTQTAGQDGPAPVPTDLAARAFRAVLAAKEEPSASKDLWNALLMLLRPATAMAVATAALLLAISVGHSGVTTDSSVGSIGSDPLQTLASRYAFIPSRTLTARALLDQEMP